MKKALALLLAIVMILGLAACNKDPGSSSADPGNPTTPGSQQSGSQTPGTDKPTEPGPAKKKVLYDYTGSEAFTLFGQNSSSAYDGDLLAYTGAALYGYKPIDRKAALVPVLADGEPIDVNGDGLTWNIKIKKEAKFANGEPINADVFMFTLKLTLDPKMAFYGAGSVAKGLIEILNAPAYVDQNKEGASPVAWEDVGIKKIDDYTIQIVTAVKTNALRVMLHFSGKTTMPIYEPIYTACLSADGLTTDYGSTPEKYVGCGPYNLVEWKNEDYKKFEKNPLFVFADDIKIDERNIRYVKDKNAQQQMFEAGEVASLGLDMDLRNEYGDDPRIVHTPSRTNNMLEILVTNTENPILGNYNFRLALYYAFDRVALSKINNWEPSMSLTPLTSGGKEDGTLYTTYAKEHNTYLAQDTYGYDPVLAVQYFEKALKEVGQTSAEVKWTVTEGGYSRCAEYCQEAWNELFGGKLKVNVDLQTNAVISEMRKAWKDNPNAYELCSLGVAPSASDYDPGAALKSFISPYGTRALHENEKAKAFYDQEILELDPDEKYRLTMECEKALQETMTAIPLAASSSYTIFADWYLPAIDPENYTVSGGWCSAYADVVVD